MELFEIQQKLTYEEWCERFDLVRAIVHAHKHELATFSSILAEYCGAMTYDDAYKLHINMSDELMVGNYINDMRNTTLMDRYKLVLTSDERIEEIFESYLEYLDRDLIPKFREKLSI